ncbi:MAG: protein TolR [Parasphingorhabdus sp.]|nr:protein TolR [Parasphingorhabdus sp.]
MAMNLPSRGGRGSRRAPMAEINVTPLVDVMLVLLIIFMVTAPLLVTGVPVDLPESRANALDQDKEPVQISIDPKGDIFVDEDPVTVTELPARLAAIAASQSADNPRQIMLRGDRALDYGKVMAVMGELNRAGLNRVSLVTTGSSSKR